MKGPVRSKAAGSIARARRGGSSAPWSFLTPPLYFPWKAPTDGDADQGRQRPVNDPTLGGFVGRPPPWAEFTQPSLRAERPRPAPSSSNASVVPDLRATSAAGLTVTSPSDPAEREADALAAGATSSAPDPG